MLDKNKIRRKKTEQISSSSFEFKLRYIVDVINVIDKKHYHRLLDLLEPVDLKKEKDRFLNIGIKLNTYFILKKLIELKIDTLVINLSDNKFIKTDNKIHFRSKINYFTSQLSDISVFFNEKIEKKIYDDESWSVMASRVVDLYDEIRKTFLDLIAPDIIGENDNSDSAIIGSSKHVIETPNPERNTSPSVDMPKGDKPPSPIKRIYRRAHDLPDENKSRNAAVNRTSDRITIRVSPQFLDSVESAARDAGLERGEWFSSMFEMYLATSSNIQPPDYPDYKASKSIDICLSPSLMSQVRDAAERVNLKPAKWIRRVSHFAISSPEQTQELDSPPILH